MSIRRKCVKITGLILAIAVGLLVSGLAFDSIFCTSGAPTLTSLGADVAEKKPDEKLTKKSKPKKIKKRRARKENIRSQQSKIKERLIKLDKVLDRKLDQIRRLKHHDGPTTTTRAGSKSD